MLQIRFYPRRTQDYTFNGHMWIHDTTFALQSIRLHLSENVNMNFMKVMGSQQKYSFTQGRWLLEDEKVLVDLKPVTKNSVSILGRKTSKYSKYDINKGIPIVSGEI